MRLIQAALSVAPGRESVCPERIGNKGVKLFDCQQKRYIFALDAFSDGRTPIRRGKMGRFALRESVSGADLLDLGGWGMWIPPTVKISTVTPTVKIIGQNPTEEISRGDPTSEIFAEPP